MSCYINNCWEPRRERGIYCVNHSCQYGHCYDEKILSFTNQYDFCRRHTCGDDQCHNRKWTASRGSYCKHHTCKKRHCFERNHVINGVGNRFCILHIEEGLRTASGTVGMGTDGLLPVAPVLGPAELHNEPIPVYRRPVPAIVVSSIPDDRSIMSSSSAGSAQTDGSWNEVLSSFPVPTHPPR